MRRFHATHDYLAGDNERDSGEFAGNDDFRDTCNQKNEVLIGGRKVSRNLITDSFSTSYELRYRLSARETSAIRAFVVDAIIMRRINK